MDRLVSERTGKSCLNFFFLYLCLVCLQECLSLIILSDSVFLFSCCLLLQIAEKNVIFKRFRMRGANIFHLGLLYICILEFVSKFVPELTIVVGL